MTKSLDGWHVTYINEYYAEDGPKVIKGFQAPGLCCIPNPLMLIKLPNSRKSSYYILMYKFFMVEGYTRSTSSWKWLVLFYNFGLIKHSTHKRQC